MTSRREFLRLGAVVGVSALAPKVPFLGRARKILVLGGTSFIGPHQVQYALDRGHEVTLFNRGRTNSDLFPGVEKLIGDRNGQLDALRGRRWDLVIDNSATDPEWVRQTAALLKDTVDRYFYVSSRSAYQHFRRIPMTAGADLRPPRRDRPLHVLAGAFPPGRRGARARRRHRRRADHRRAGRQRGFRAVRSHSVGRDRADFPPAGRHGVGHAGVRLYAPTRAAGGPQGGHDGGKGGADPGRVA